MTRKEFERREKAAIAAFVDRNPELAYEYVMQIIEYNAKETVFRFRPPLDREVDILKEKKIFLCKPREYKDDGDNAILFNIIELYRYFMLEMKPEKYGRYKNMLDSDFDDRMVETLENNPKYHDLCEKIRNESLIACFSANYDDYMWTNYAQDSEGICIVYNLKELFLNLAEGLKLFPVRYVDNRRKQSDIRFGITDYGKEESCYDNEHYKYVLSCLTKDKHPFYKEAEWRLFSEYEDIPVESAGRKFTLAVKPVCIVLGKNIDKHPVFKRKVIEFADESDIKVMDAK